MGEEKQYKTRVLEYWKMESWAGDLIEIE